MNMALTSEEQSEKEAIERKLQSMGVYPYHDPKNLDCLLTFHAELRSLLHLPEPVCTCKKNRRQTA